MQAPFHARRSRALRRADGLGVALWLSLLGADSRAVDFEVGPGQTYAAIGDVPWESLEPGDRVLIHWRDTPYRDKWVIGRSGTADQPIVVRGVPAPDGSLPVIDGRDATTRSALNYDNEARGVIKIGTSNVPAQTLPSYIVIDGLEVRSARPPFSFSGHGGGVHGYDANAASIYVEVARHLTIRNCILRDSANGLFVSVRAGETQDILIERNWVYDNGIEGSLYQHNSYTAALGIIFQYNHYGPLRAGCGGNNLKDRSAGLVVRYNWLEGGSRQLDLVDGEDHASVLNEPRYHQTFVFGNVLHEPTDDGNSQIVHYGGDSANPYIYRKGTLYFFNNTVVSGRSGNTTLLRLSTNEEHADVRNNVVYARAGAGYLAIVGESGTLELAGNWLSSGWTTSHDSFGGTLTDLGNLDGDGPPGFADEAGEDFTLAPASSCIDAASELDADVLPSHDVLNQYFKHQTGMQRAQVGGLDVGAFEYCESDCPDPDGGVVEQPDGGWSSSSSSGSASSSGDTSSGAGNGSDVRPGGASGCGCGVKPARGPGAAVFFGLLLIAAMRRRSRSAAATMPPRASPHALRCDDADPLRWYGPLLAAAIRATIARHGAPGKWRRRG